MATALNSSEPKTEMMAGLDPAIRVAAWFKLAHAGVWALLLFRWVTFSSISWNAFPFENALANNFSGLFPYLLYGGGAILGLIFGAGLLRNFSGARIASLIWNAILVIFGFAFFFITGEFYGPIFIVGVSGMVLVLLSKHTAWAINYPAAFWLVTFFVLPNIIVLIISLGERGPRGTLIYPPAVLLEDGFAGLFNDYTRFFSRISGELIYLQIFWRTFLLALANTAICLLFGYPFAFWIARQPERYRNILIFLVMIPFWTNFLVRTYALLLILRDSGLINSFWTSTLHEQAVALSGNSPFFTWIAAITENPLPLIFNTGSVLIGLLYGFFPFVVLPLYSNLEKLDWSLLEAAADLGANGFYRFTRILLPLSMPGIVAAAIIVFIPSLGAYVTPAIMGGGKVSLLGNLLQQQFLTTRDWPFGSAIGFLMMAIMLLAIMLYFRVADEEL